MKRGRERDRQGSASYTDNPPGSIIRRESPRGLRDHDRLVRQPGRGDPATGTGCGNLGGRGGCYGCGRNVESDAGGRQPEPWDSGRAVHSTGRLFGRHARVHAFNNSGLLSHVKGKGTLGNPEGRACRRELAGEAIRPPPAGAETAGVGHGAEASGGVNCTSHAEGSMQIRNQLRDKVAKKRYRTPPNTA